MLHCRQAQAMLSRALDGALGPREATAFQTHVDACPACRAEMESLQTAWDLLASDADQPAAPDLTARVFARLDAPATRPDSRARVWGPVFRGALAAACVALALVGGGMLGHWTAAGAAPSEDRAPAQTGFASYFGPAPPLTLSGAYAGLHAHAGDQTPGVD